MISLSAFATLLILLVLPPKENCSDYQAKSAYSVNKELKEITSVGQYFNSNIRDKFGFDREI